MKTVANPKKGRAAARRLRELAAEYGDRLDIAIAQEALMEGPKAQAGYERLRGLLALRELWEEIEQFAEAYADRGRIVRKGGMS